MVVLILNITETDRDHDFSGLSDWAYDKASDSYQKQIRIHLDVVRAHLDKKMLCRLKDVRSVAADVQTVGQYDRDEVEGITLAESTPDFRLIRTPKNDVAIQIASTNKATAIGKVIHNNEIVFEHSVMTIALSSYGDILCELLVQNEDSVTITSNKRRHDDTDDCVCLQTNDISEIIAKRVRTAYEKGIVIDLS